MKIFIDQQKCVAAGQCVAYAPNVFDQREEDGIVFFVNEDPPPEEHQNIRQAAAVCPALAIRIEE